MPSISTTSFNKILVVVTIVHTHTSSYIIVVFQSCSKRCLLKVALVVVAARTTTKLFVGIAFLA